MKVLITGASSPLGEKFAEILQSHKIQPILLYHKNKPNLKAISFSIDLTDKQSLIKLKKKIGKIDTIVHLAAYVPKKNSEDLLLPSIETNITATANLLDVFGVDIKKIIYASTIEVYGLNNKNGKIRETDKAEPPSYYATGKLAGEKILELFSTKNDLQFSILRFASMYGYYDEIERALPNFIKSCLDKKNPTVYGGSDLRDYLHIDDATNALYLSLSSKKSGIFNIGSGKGISIVKVAELVKNSINPKLRVDFRKPNKKPADLVLNINKAKKELNYIPKYHFPDKLDETISWYR